MTKICDAVTILATFLSFYIFGENNAVNSALEEVIGPVGKEIADVYKDWRRRVIFGGRREYGDWRPDWIRPWREDLETGLTGALEKKGYRAIV